MTARAVKVMKTWAETPTLTGVLLEAPPEVLSDHAQPGQVIAAKSPTDEKVYLALASSPGDPHLELLASPGAVDRLGLADGQVLEIEGPFGKGFALEAAEGKDVLLFAVGSALAPIRPLIDLIRKDRSNYGMVTLFIGALAADAFAYAAQYEAWKRDRIDVVKVLDPEFVQNVFAQDPLPLENGVAFVCGMGAMMDGVTQTLVEHGLDAEKVYRNW